MVANSNPTNVTKRQNWVIKKVKKKANHLVFNVAKSSAPERKRKQRKENKGNGGSSLTPGKTIQSERLVDRGTRLTKGASPQWPWGAFTPPRLALPERLGARLKRFWLHCKKLTGLSKERQAYKQNWRGIFFPLFLFYFILCVFKFVQYREVTWQRHHS